MKERRSWPFSSPLPGYLAPACLDDFEVVAQLFAALHGYNASLNEKFALAPDWRTVFYDHFTKTVTAASSLWLLAWVGSQPAGLLILEEHYDSLLFQHRRRVELVALYVDTPFRGTGLAQQLMYEAQTWAQAHDETCMQLYVTVQNEHARAFYRRCGWYPVQEIWHMDIIPGQRSSGSESLPTTCAKF
jgi:ribosomal protein S18 acetylase RimI-like enzyme